MRCYYFTLCLFFMVGCADADGFNGSSGRNVKNEATVGVDSKGHPSRPPAEVPQDDEQGKPVSTAPAPTPPTPAATDVKIPANCGENGFTFAHLFN